MFLSKKQSVSNGETICFLVNKSCIIAYKYGV